MSWKHDGPATDVLDRATDALREAPVSGTPPERCVAATMVLLRSQATPPKLPRAAPARERHFYSARYSGVAAALALLAIVGSIAWFVNQGTKEAFGQVINNVKNATSVSLRLTRLGPEFNAPAFHFRIYEANRLFRLEMPGQQEAIDTGMPLAMVCIVDMRRKEVLQLEYATKTAYRFKMDEERVAPPFISPMEAFQTLTDQDAELVGDEQLRGVAMRVYRLKQLNYPFVDNRIGKLGIEHGPNNVWNEVARLWVDAEDRLPAQMVLEVYSADRKKNRWTFDDFEWNEPLDPELFRMDPPAGFTTVHGKPEVINLQAGEK